MPERPSGRSWAFSADPCPLSGVKRTSVEHPAVVKSCSDDDGIEGSMLRPPLVAIADLRRNVAVAETFEVATGHFAKLWHDLDRVHLAGEHGQDRRLVPRPGAHLQDLICL